MYYFENCEKHKLQWLSLFIQCKLYEKPEYERQELFALAFTEWSKINKTDPIREYEVDLILSKIIENNHLINVKVKMSNNKILMLTNRIKTWLLTPVI